MFAAWLVSLALLATASAESYTLHHRYSGGAFAPRGVVSVTDGVATFTPDSNVGGSGDGEWYQVALEVNGDMITTSTRSCFADQDAALTVRVTSNGRPTAIAYRPSGVPNDGSCPSEGVGARSLPQKEVVVDVEVPQKVYSPGLAAPPPVDTATGKVVEPEPEKTFLQKYGLMLGGIAFVLMLNAAAPPEEGQGGTAQAPARR